MASPNDLQNIFHTVSVSGLPLWLSIVLVGVIGTIYTSLVSLALVISVVVQNVSQYINLVVFLVCFTFSGYLGLYGHKRFESRDMLRIVRDVSSAIFLSGLVKP